MTILLDDDFEANVEDQMRRDASVSTDRYLVRLRDYFAAHAPWARAHFLSDPTDEGVEKVAARMAKQAYAFADAMLEARKK